MLDQRTLHARALFGGIAAAYETRAAMLSLGQYGRWRRALVRSLGLAPSARVLDVATGTGLIARDLGRRYGCHVVGLDQSAPMLRGARARGLRDLAGGSADALPFPDERFDCVTFSYLLRYVPDPHRTLAELARVVRRGGVLASVEFGLPGNGLARAGWRAYARGVFPVACRALGPAWNEVGRFLPGSIESWARDWPPERQLEAWRAAGVSVDAVVARTMGAGTILIGTKADA